MPSPHSPAATTVGVRVRDRRRALGISQMDLAELASMHFTNVGKIERGEANPSLVTIVRLAVALNVDPGELVEGIGAEDLPSLPHRLTAADLIRERRRRERAG